MSGSALVRAAMRVSISPGAMALARTPLPGVVGGDGARQPDDPGLAGGIGVRVEQPLRADHARARTPWSRCCRRARACAGSAYLQARNVAAQVDGHDLVPRFRRAQMDGPVAQSCARRCRHC